MEHEFDENCGGIEFEELVDPDVEEDEEDMEPEETDALSDIGMLRYSDGWGIKELLEDLRFPVKELIHYGPHGHGTNGVCYIE